MEMGWLKLGLWGKRTEALSFEPILRWLPRLFGH